MLECVSNVTTPPAYTSCTLRRDDLNFVSVSLPFRNSLILSLFPSLSSKTSLYSSSMSSSDDVIQSVGFMSENLTFQPQNHRCVTALKLCLHSSLFCRKEETRLVSFETRSLWSRRFFVPRESERKVPSITKQRALHFHHHHFVFYWRSES